MFVQVARPTPVGPVDQKTVYVATKVAYMDGARRENINATFEASQRPLNLNCIYLFYPRRLDNETLLEEAFEALARLQ